MDERTIKFGISEGLNGDLLLVEWGNGWCVLAGTLYKRKLINVEQVFYVPVYLLKARINDWESEENDN